MFDIAPTELLLVAVIALIVIGPKDLPRAMRFVGNWVARARGVVRHFRSGLDEMIRQAELEEMEKKWAAENERIMREHAAPPDPDAANYSEMTPVSSAPNAVMAENVVFSTTADPDSAVLPSQPVLPLEPPSTTPGRPSDSPSSEPKPQAP